MPIWAMKKCCTQSLRGPVSGCTSDTENYKVEPCKWESVNDCALGTLLTELKEQISDSGP